MGRLDGVRIRASKLELMAMGRVLMGMGARAPHYGLAGSRTRALTSPKGRLPDMANYLMSNHQMCCHKQTIIVCLVILNKFYNFLK